MEIRIGEELLAKTIAAAVEKAVSAGVGAWETSHAIEDATKAAVVEANLPTLIGQELQRRLATDTDRIVRESVDCLLPGMRAAIKVMCTEMTTRILYGMRHAAPSAYSKSEQAAWADCRRIAAGDESVAPDGEIAKQESLV